MDFLVSDQQLHRKITLSTLVEEALVFLVRDIVLNDVFLIGVYELFDVIESLRVSEALGPYLLMDILALIAIVGIYQRHYEFLVLVFLELVGGGVGSQLIAEIEDVEVVQVRFEKELDPELHVDSQLFLQL